MSTAFGERYGVEFEAIANGIDIEAYRRVNRAAQSMKGTRDEVVLRYFGSLAEDMTLHTVIDVARAVDALQDEAPVRLEVYTMRAWRRRFANAVAGLRGVMLLETVPDEEYPSVLAEADVLVLGYNFDADSVRYVRFSMPNKLPEYLGSGTAVLAVGPSETAGIDYLSSRQLGCCVTERDPAKLREAVQYLATDSGYRDELGAKAQAWAFEHFDIGSISSRFQAIIREAAEDADKRRILGPFPRRAGAHMDEGKAIARLLEARGPERVLIDVGAHRGSSLGPFSKAGWTVVACEPDASNRARLVERFGDKPNVTIDQRAVSDEPAEGVAFFSSDESTGISALHTFRESHHQSAAVDVTTVAELLDDHGLSNIDFLKIDVEGFDWNVLKGVPWDRVKPRVIECEFEDAKTVSLGHTYRDMADFLVERGYIVYLSEWHPIVRYGVRHQWRQLLRYPAPLGSADAWGNIVAFREDPGLEALGSTFAECLEIEDPAAAEADEHEPGSAVSADQAAPIQATVREGGPPRPSGLSRIARAVRLGNGRQSQEHGVMPQRRVPRARRLAGWAAWLAVLAGLVVAGFVTPVEPYRLLLWSAAGLLGVAGASFWTLRAIRRRRDPTVLTGLSLQERFFLWAKSRGPVAVPIGRLVLWLVRRARRYPVLVLPYVAVLAALVVVGFLPAVEPYGPIAWSAAGLLVVVGAIGISTGYAGFLVRQADQESQLQRNQTRVRLDHARQRLARAEVRHDSIRKRLAQADVRDGRLREHLDQTVSSLRSAQNGAREALEAKIAELEGDQGAAREALEARIAELEGDQGAARETRGIVEARIADLEADQAGIREALQDKIDELEREQEATRGTVEVKLGELKSKLGALAELSEAVDALGREVVPQNRGPPRGHRNTETAVSGDRLWELGFIQCSERRRLESGHPPAGRLYGQRRGATVDTASAPVSRSRGGVTERWREQLGGTPKAGCTCGAVGVDQT